MYTEQRVNLVEMIALLDREGCAWAGHFRKALLAFDRGDLDHCGHIILSGSGGMGSLNDLVLGQTRAADGAFRWKDGYAELNEHYQGLLEKLYAFAHAIQRAAQRR
jgi:hypothetical protein